MDALSARVKSLEAADWIRLVNLLTGLLMILGGISQFFYPSFSSIIVGLYIIVFGSAVVALEFVIPSQVAIYASFMFSFLGRGIFYIFVGVLTLNQYVLRIIAGVLVALVGVGFIVCHFLKVEPPKNMQNAEMESQGRQPLAQEG